MSALTPMLAWTFTQEIPIPPEVNALLVEGEAPVCSYKTIRDTATITTKRIIIADAQGLSGKKVEVYTIPFKSIVMYSTENAGGIFDINAELELWTRAGHFKINLAKGIDIRKIDRIIASYIL
ncbi:MAG: PH domain-containing protein [Rhodothermales bacterium]|nr:PH domain-containing protein [Rhodothermales bacterium]